MRMLVVAFFVTRMATGEPETATLPPAAEIAAAEIAFAGQSVADGLNTAFAANFAEHAVDFAPLPREQARAHYLGPNPPVVLDWYPTFTLAAASGDFGLSTGPFEMRDPKGERPAGYGHYVSVWEKQPDGQWKVVIDGGTSHPRPAVPPVALLPNAMTDKRVHAEAAWAGTSADDLKAQDDELSRTASVRGLAGALGVFAADDLRWYRDGVQPLLGKASALAFAETLPGAWRWEAQGARIASSGDLGFTYGRSVRSVEHGEEHGAFLHVWRRGPTGWELLLARESAVPGQAVGAS